MCSTTRDPDRKVVLAAMEQRADALQYASAELKGDREVVLAAVQRDGSALQYASAELAADPKVVLAAVLMPAFATEDRRSALFRRLYSVAMISILSSGFSSDWEGMTSSINGILAFICLVTFEHAFESGWNTMRDTVDMAATISFVIFFIDVLSSTVTVVSLVA